MKIAIVTGASSGMGKDFAKLLDNEKLDEIWAVARTLAGLQDLASTLKTKVKTITLDLSDINSIAEIKQMLSEQKPEVCWLVNCAGFGKFNDYASIKTETSLNMIDLNCKAMVALTDACVPFMKRGARIVDFSSVAAFQPVPFGNIYAATKAFVLSYARGLSYELMPLGISVTCVCPYWTQTNFFKRAVSEEDKVVKKYIVMYKSEKVVKKAYKFSLKRKRLCIYGAFSNFQVLLTKLLPASLVCHVWLSQQKLLKRVHTNAKNEGKRVSSEIKPQNQQKTKK